MRQLRYRAGETERQAALASAPSMAMPEAKPWQAKKRASPAGGKARADNAAQQVPAHKRISMQSLL